MAITRVNTFLAQPGRADALRDFLASVIALIVSAPGCQSVELLVATEDRHQLAIIETWESVAAHQRAASGIPADLLRQAQELFATSPAGAYYLSVARQTGARGA